MHQQTSLIMYSYFNVTVFRNILKNITVHCLCKYHHTFVNKIAYMYTEEKTDTVPLFRRRLSLYMSDIKEWWAVVFNLAVYY